MRLFHARHTLKGKRGSQLTPHHMLHPSITTLLSALSFWLQGKEVRLIDISLIENTGLKISFSTNQSTSTNIKVEVLSVMSFTHSFLNSGKDQNSFIEFDYILADVFNQSGSKVMYVISPVEVFESVSKGKPINWLKQSIFQDYSADFLQANSKRYISALENSTRNLVRDILSGVHGKNWWKQSVSKKVQRATEGKLDPQDKVSTLKGDELIFFTYLLDLKKIIISNWEHFSHIFKNQEDFSSSLEQLNEIRRLEAHNRSIDAEAFEKLESIYKSLMSQIASVKPDLTTQFCVEHWHSQLIRIFEQNMEEYKFVAPDPNNFESVISSLILQAQRYEDLEVKISSLSVPLGKEKLHDQLVKVISDVKLALIEIINAVKQEEFHRVEELQRKSERASKRLQDFRDKLLMSEI